jgi:hypothetical protein
MRCIEGLRRLPMQEVQAFPVTLPDGPAQSLVQMAAEEIEALFAVVELHSPRLLRVQLEPETLQDDPDACLGLLARRLRLADDHEVVAVTHQRPQRGALA